MTTLAMAQLSQMVRQAATEGGIDPNVAHAILLTENSGRDSADTETVSPKKARGVMQVTPDTERLLVKGGFLAPGTDTSTPLGQVQAGIAALKDLKSRGITDPTEMSIGYNAAPSVLEAYRKGQPIPDETRKYIPSFQNNFAKVGGKMATSNGSSISSSISGRTFDPEDERNVDTAVDKYSAVSKSVTTQLAGLLEQLKGVSETQVVAVRAQGEAAAQAALADGNILAKKSDNSYNILTQFGINPNDPNMTAIKDNVQVIATNQQKRNELQSQIATMRSTNPFEHPLDWLVNGFKAMPLAQEHNALAAQENNAIDNIAQLQSLAKNQSEVQPADIAQEAKTKALAQATLERAGAEAKVGEIRGSIIQMTAKNLHETLAVAGADVQTRLAVAKLFAEQTRESYGMRIHAEEKKEQADVMAPINLALQAQGVPNFVPMSYKTWSNLDADAKQRLVRLGSGSAGVDLAETITTLYQQFGRQGMEAIKDNDPAKGLLIERMVRAGDQKMKEAYREVEADPTKMKTIPPELKLAKSDADRLQWGIRAVQEQFKGELDKGDYTKLSSDNPYKLNYNMLSKVPQLKDNKTVQFLSSMSAAGKLGQKTILDDRLIFAQAAGRVAAGENVDAVSNELEQLYTVGSKAQTNASSVNSMGMPYVSQYPMYLPSRMGDRAVQGMSAASIKRYLTIEVARTTAADTQLGQ